MENKDFGKEIEKHLVIAMKLMENAGIIGKNFTAEGKYMMFSFRDVKKKCKECGQEINE